MRRHTLLLEILAAMVLALGGSGVVRAEKGPEDSALAKASETIKERYQSHVFTVNAWSKLPGNASGEKASGMVKWQRKIGTAFPLNECSYLVTPSCVVRNAEKVRVISQSGEELAAEIIGTDTNWRIAVLKVAIDDGSMPLPVASWDSINVGQRIILLGNRKEQALTARFGTIDTIRRNEGNFIVSTSGKPGTTGSPVFTADARLLGMLTYHVHADDQKKDIVEFAPELFLVIPMDYIMIVARSIIDRHEGERGWLGIRISLANRESGENGVLVQHIFDNSPAALCGLKINDRIVGYNGRTISTVRDMCEAAAAASIGEKVKITVMRDTRSLSFNATLTGPPVSQ